MLWKWKAKDGEKKTNEKAKEKATTVICRQNRNEKGKDVI